MDCNFISNMRAIELNIMQVRMSDGKRGILLSDINK